VIDLGVGLLFVAALFQLFDGVQAVATGALRGLGNTQTPMFVNLIGHWALGLPVAYLLCFKYGRGVQGLWLGLAFGLTFAGAVLLGVWRRQSQALTHPAGT
jgi:MATE family multidrug resistance protein